MTGPHFRNPTYSLFAAQGPLSLGLAQDTTPLILDLVEADKRWANADVALVVQVPGDCISVKCKITPDLKSLLLGTRDRI